MHIDKGCLAQPASLTGNTLVSRKWIVINSLSARSRGIGMEKHKQLIHLSMLLPMAILPSKMAMQMALTRPKAKQNMDMSQTQETIIAEEDA